MCGFMDKREAEIFSLLNISIHSLFSGVKNRPQNNRFGETTRARLGHVLLLILCSFSPKHMPGPQTEDDGRAHRLSVLQDDDDEGRIIMERGCSTFTERKDVLSDRISRISMNGVQFTRTKISACNRLLKQISLLVSPTIPSPDQTFADQRPASSMAWTVFPAPVLCLGVAEFLCLYTISLSYLPSLETRGLGDGMQIMSPLLPDPEQRILRSSH